MKVKALCMIKDENGTHEAGEIFETDANLGNLVEVLEDQPEPEAEPEKPKTTRRKKA